MAVALYHANFLSENYRPFRRNAVSFGAASDGDAATVATELGNWTTGKLGSLMANRGGGGTAGPYPLGTRITCKATVADATGAVWTVRFRNVNAGVTAADVTAFLEGIVGGSGIGATLTALSAPPLIPGSGQPIVAVLSANLITKY